MLRSESAKRIRDLLLEPEASEGRLPDITRLVAVARMLTPKLLVFGEWVAFQHPEPRLGTYVIGVFASRLPKYLRSIFWFTEGSPWFFDRFPWFPDRSFRSYNPPPWRMPEYPQKMTLVLKALAPILDGDELDEALNFASRISESKWRGLALAYLAPHLYPERLGKVVELISDIEDPFDLTTALIAVSPVVPDMLLEPLRKATLKIGIGTVRTLAVKALDTQWEPPPNRGYALRLLLSDLPWEQRREFEERLQDWNNPLEFAPLTAFRDEFESLTRDVDEGDFESAMEATLVEMERIFFEESSERYKGNRRAKPPESSWDIRSNLAFGFDSADQIPASLSPPESMAPAEAAPAEAAPAKGEVGPPLRVVNTGFVSALKPDESLVGVTLACKRIYYFWIDVGAPRADSIEAEPQSLPDLPAGTTLRIVVFGFPRQLIIKAGGQMGDLRLLEDGRAVVTRAASVPPTLSKNAPILRRQLFFYLETPATPGSYSLRCSIYHRSNLLQSRVVTARVTSAPEAMEGALVSHVDYAISRSLDPAHLKGLTEQKLSLMLNDNGNGTHGLRFVGSKDFVSEAVVGEGVLSSAIDVTRKALHQASWGSPDPWDAGKPLPYLYENRGSEDRLFKDLISIAIRGHKLYFEMCLTMTGGRKKFDLLAKMMRTPGSVQIALKMGANHVLPAALFYDHPIDTQKDHVICPAFAEALSKPEPIEMCDCLQGRCPSHGIETVVCPSGFWGYRHDLGLPLTVAEDEDAPTEIVYGPAIALGMCVAADLQFGPHEKAVKDSCKNLEIMVVQDRDEALRVMREQAFQVVYFYCHGGSTQDGFPTLVMGPGAPIAAENLLKVQWTAPRPLVFLNGCHTAALKPETMLNLVNAFVQASGATGVIGTEVTIFESLARPFAEACLNSFLAGGKIGEAVRHARIRLLQRHLNPLGLVYIPYVSTGVRLVNSV